MGRYRLAASALAVAMLAGPALAADNSGHRRQAIDLSTPPWRAIGRVQTELGARCTGFLIAPRLVMTAGHCLYRSQTYRYVQPRSVHFLWRYAAGQYAAHARVVSFSVAPGYQPTAEDWTMGLDRAVLILDRSLGQPGDYAPVASAPPGIGTPLMLGGYNRDRAEVAEADTQCRLIGLARDKGGHPILAHDCRGLQGTSGAPLFARQADGGWAVAGIEVAITGPGGAVGLAPLLLDLPANR